MIKYSIVIPTYNHLEDCLKPCIESIVKYTDLEQIKKFGDDTVEVIVVANGCTDKTREYVESQHQGFRLLWFDEPLGFTKAVNEGIKVSKGKYVVILNNDTKLTPQEKNKWLKELEKPFNELLGVGITGPHRLYSHVIDDNFIVFFCAMIKKELFDKIGLLDEDFTSPGGCEDIDFCRRARNAGYRVVRVPDNDDSAQKFPIFHQAEATMKTYPRWEEIFWENTKKLIDKHAKVAVIMPVYNDKYVEAAVRNVFFQTHLNLRLFIVDDCSNDDTRRVLDDLEDEFGHHIALVRLPFNVGPSNARNIALSAIKRDSSFTHVAFCDSDDFWHSGHLAYSLFVLEYKKADVVYSDVDCKFEDGKHAEPFGISNPSQFSREELLKGNFIYISSVVATRRAIMNAQFDSRLDSIEDWDFWCQIAEQNYKFARTEVKLLTYTVKTSGNSASKLSVEKRALLHEKHKLVKLNLGCGLDLKPGYINCDLHPKNPEIRNVDCRFLPFADNSVDEILASHLVEHFPFPTIGSLLKEWHRALKPGGKLVLETPDAYHTYKAFVERPDLRLLLMGHIHAFPMEPGNAHFFLFSEDHLRWILGEVGFKNVKRIKPFSNYVQDHPKEWYLAVECIK